MNAGLPKELEEYVQKEVASGEDRRRILKSLLLQAVTGPHIPLPSDYFDQLRRRFVLVACDEYAHLIPGARDLPRRVTLQKDLKVQFSQ